MNSDFNPELYQEMCLDNGCQYDNEIKDEMFDSYMCDYI